LTRKYDTKDKIVEAAKVGFFSATGISLLDALTGNAASVNRVEALGKGRTLTDKEKEKNHEKVTKSFLNVSDNIQDVKDKLNPLKNMKAAAMYIVAAIVLILIILFLSKRSKDAAQIVMMANPATAALSRMV